MYAFEVNGQSVNAPLGEKKLLQYLRDDLRLTSVKEGCSEGACGSCMVLVDGKATRACIPTMQKVAGKQIMTVEGLSAREKEVYAYAFAAAGAVQCGFCIPGMVISAKGLLDATPDPTREEVKKAIKFNICRCTGYIKIEDAILLAAKILREGSPIPTHEFAGKLGEDFHRLDADEKTLGTGLYTDDMVVDGMVFATALRSKHPRAKVLSIDASAAQAHPDCIRVITAADIPGENKIGHLAFISDWDTLIAVGDITRYLGDAVALVVGAKKETLEEIRALVNVEYEVLEPVTSPVQALAEGAPKLHEKGNLLFRQELKRGDADAAIAASKHVVIRHYSLPFTEHAFMEPECAIAMPDGEDGVMIYSGGQGIYDEQREVSRMLGIPPEKVRVRGMLVGGGFGGKEDMSVQHHAALAAWVVRKPVKVKLSRAESLIVHPKRHAMEIDFTTACDENGKITAMKAEIISDAGSYASLSGPVLQRACTHAGGPYNFEHLDVVGMTAYTNNPPGGAFRGFGVPQSTVARECNLNLLAEMVGITPWEIRYRNAIRPGQVLHNGQIADDSTAMAECLLAVKGLCERNPKAGIAAAFKNSGLGVGVPDISRCIVSVEGGKIHVRSSAACIGQGMATVLSQMVCEALGISPSLLVIEPPDTSRTPNAGTTTASRQTTLTGEAAVLAAKALGAEIDILRENGCSLEDALGQLEGREFYREFGPPTDPMGAPKPFPVSHLAYGYAVQVVELDEAGKLERVTAAYDIGRVVNPKAAEGQIEGGILMGLGYALTEDFPVEGGHPKVKYGTLGLTRATETPAMETIFVESANGQGRIPAAHGAKGVGELATIPTAPAVLGAYYNLDGQFRQKLPMEDTFYRKKK